MTERTITLKEYDAQALSYILGEAINDWDGNPDKIELRKAAKEELMLLNKKIAGRPRVRLARNPRLIGDPPIDPFEQGVNEGYEAVAREIRNRKAQPTNPRTAYLILETEYDPEKGFNPCIVKENESGYYRTDWFWGKNLDLAKEAARQKNEAMGLTPQDVQDIVDSSLKLSFQNEDYSDYDQNSGFSRNHNR